MRSGRSGGKPNRNRRLWDVSLAFSFETCLYRVQANEGVSLGFNFGVVTSRHRRGQSKLVVLTSSLAMAMKSKDFGEVANQVVSQESRVANTGIGGRPAGIRADSFIHMSHRFWPAKQSRATNQLCGLQWHNDQDANKGPGKANGPRKSLLSRSGHDSVVSACTLRAVEACKPATLEHGQDAHANTIKAQE